MPHYFLSYSRSDMGFADRLAGDLSSAGSEIWVDRKEVRAGEEWDRSVVNALEECGALVVILSPESVDSANVADEVGFALDRGKPILPVLLRECEIPLRLRRRQRIDFSDYELGLERLRSDLALIDAAIPKPSAPDQKEERLDVSGLFTFEIEPDRRAELSNLRFLFEEFCCLTSRLHHMREDGLEPSQVIVTREVALSSNREFADIRVIRAGAAPYFIEVKLGYTEEDLRDAVKRKYGSGHHRVAKASKLIVVLDRYDRDPDSGLTESLAKLIDDNLELEIWDEPKLKEMARKYLKIGWEGDLQSAAGTVRSGLQQTYGRIAFKEWNDTPLQSNLIWHLGCWNLRARFQEADEKEILAPDSYPEVVILIADLCSFDSYLRDTSDNEVMRDALLAFYSRARYEVLNADGVFYRHQGDQIVAFFQLTHKEPEDASRALRCATALIDIGFSVSNHWQRAIDRKQESEGLRVALAMGTVDILPTVPYSSEQMTVVSEGMNVAHALLEIGQPGQILASRRFLGQLDKRRRRAFSPAGELKMKNGGSIDAHRLTSQST